MNPMHLYERTVLLAIALVALAGLLPPPARVAARLLYATAFVLVLVCFVWLRP